MTNKDLQDRIERNLSRYYKSENGSHWYFIPELDKWVNCFNKKIRELGYTQRYWYNKVILEIDDPEFKPTCQLDECSNLVKNFKGTKYGYPKYCCSSHKMKDKDRLDKFLSTANSPEALLKKSITLKLYYSTPKGKFQRSRISSDLWKDSGYRSRNLSKIPNGNCVSKISLECFSELNNIFRIFGWGSGLYGNNEKKVITGEEYSDIKGYRKLDYCHELLNFVIEFQGDHWHPRDSTKFSEEKILESVNNDISKFNAIKLALSTDNYFYIYESKYKNNKAQVIQELIEDIFYSIESW